MLSFALGQESDRLVSSFQIKPIVSASWWVGCVPPPAFPSAPGAASSVSAWRTFLIANEWNELQTRRKVNPSLQLFATLLLLEVSQRCGEGRSSLQGSGVKSRHSRRHLWGRVLEGERERPIPHLAICSCKTPNLLLCCSATWFHSGVWLSPCLPPTSAPPSTRPLLIVALQVSF